LIESESIDSSISKRLLEEHTKHSTADTFISFHPIKRITVPFLMAEISNGPPERTIEKVPLVLRKSTNDVEEEIDRPLNGAQRLALRPGRPPGVLPKVMNPNCNKLNGFELWKTCTCPTSDDDTLLPTFTRMLIFKSLIGRGVSFKAIVRSFLWTSN
jgi:hypothetical protein